MRSSTHRFGRPALGAALLAATAMSGVAVWQVAPAFAQTAAEHTALIDVGHPGARALPGFADLVRKVGPAVVTISSTMREQSDDQASPFPPGSPQAQEFGRVFGAPRQGAVTALRDGTQNSGAVALRVLRDGHQIFIALSAALSDEG